MTLTRRQFGKAALISSVAATAAVAGVAGAQPASRGRTYVLVHGAFHGGWCWSRVAQRLTAAGHTVYTPTQTGLGERRHLLSKDITMNVFVEDIVEVIEAEELHDVYLVGHSFGGGAVTGVVDRIPQRIRRLVYLDAGIPMEGKSSFDRLPPGVRETRIKAAEEFSGGVSIPIPPANTFGLTETADVEWIQRRMTPHPLRTYMTVPTVTHPIGNGLPATYIRCTAPYYHNVDSSGAYAKSRQDWQYLEIKAGHDAMISHPEELTQILLSLA